MPPNPTGIRHRSSNASTTDDTDGPWAGTATRNSSSPSPGGLWRNFPRAMRASPSNDPTSESGNRGTHRHGTNRTAPAHCGTHCAGHGATATRHRTTHRPSPTGACPSGTSPCSSTRSPTLTGSKPPTRPRSSPTCSRAIQPTTSTAARYGRTRPSALWRASSCPAPTTPCDSPNGSPPTCRSANGSGASPANCPARAKGRRTTPTARRPAPSMHAPTTTRSSERAARSSSDNGGSGRSTPRPRTPTRQTRNGSNTWPTCWNACSPPHWRPNRSRRRWEPHGSPPRTSTTS